MGTVVHNPDDMLERAGKLAVTSQYKEHQSTGNPETLLNRRLRLSGSVWGLRFCTANKLPGRRGVGGVVLVRGPPFQEQDLHNLNLNRWGPSVGSFTSFPGASNVQPG